MPGEIFITMAKEGSTVSGLMDSFACAVSIGLAARRAAEAAVREVRAHPLRALAAGAATPTSASPSRSWITSSAGCSCASSPASSRRCSTACVPSTSTPRRRARRTRTATDRSHSAISTSRCPLPMCHPATGALLPICHPERSEAESRDLLLAASGHIHAADALKELIDFGDAPVCTVCGAIMTRNGSCYRCNECGSTSGCS